MPSRPLVVLAGAAAVLLSALLGACLSVPEAPTLVACTADEHCVEELEPGPCERAACSEAGECVAVGSPALDGTSCDDGDPCTVGDVCAAGVCEAGEPKACPAPDDCHEAGSCDPGTGDCEHPPVDDGTPCDDGRSCTEEDACTGGTCEGAERACDDGDLCTIDSCDEALGCVHSVTEGTCSDDGACDDGNPCTEDTCAASCACLFTPLPATACDDDPCTVDDVCDAAGECMGTLKACDDERECTVDSCEATGACHHDTTGCACDVDADCDDDNPCTVDACDVSAGTCTTTPDTGAACDDADPCTLGDACTAEAACEGLQVDCDDARDCTVDSCDATGLCQHDTVGCACDVDADCDDENPCTVDACDVSPGTCTHIPDIGAGCDDDDPCTESDTCTAEATCEGLLVDCDDGDPCTLDPCDADTGECLHPAAPDGTTCDDADPCTTTDTCQAGACTPGPPATFDRTYGPAEGKTTIIDVEALDDGGLVIAGQTSPTVEAPANAWLAHLGADGEPLWQKTYEIDGESFISSVVALPTGGFAMSVTELPSGQAARAKFLRTNASGAIVDEEILEGTHAFAHEVLFLGPAQGFVLVGEVETGTETGRDCFLARIDAAGAVAWQHTYGDTVAEGCSTGAIIEDGYALGGYVADPEEGVVFRVKADGTMDWRHTYGASEISAIVHIGDNTVVAAGATGSSEALDGYDLWMARIDGTGNVGPEASFGTAGLDRASDMALWGEGLLLGGVTEPGNDSDEEFWLLHTSMEGQELWSRTLQRPGRDEAIALEASADGIYMGGLARTEVDFASVGRLMKLDSNGQAECPN